MDAILAAGLPSIVCFVAAAILAYRKTECWGWFIFAGMLIAGSIKVAAS